MRHTILAGIAFIAALLFPACAFGAQPAYTVDKLDSTVYVETTSTAHIVERRTITFNEDNEGLVWYLHRPGPDDSVRIDSVRVAPTDGSSVDANSWTELVRVDSKPAEQGMSPGDFANASLRTGDVRPWYSYSISDGMIRAWFPASSETVVVELDCAILGPVSAWRDVGEFSWRYAHASWPAGQSDVTLHVALPLPVDSVVVPGSTVEAWGHGVEGGKVVVGEDGSITCHADYVPAGQYAECHAIFPVSWLTNMSLTAPQRHSETRRSDVVSGEAEWVDAYMRESMWDNKVRVLFCALAAFCILVCIVAVMRFGRTERTRRALLRLAVVLGVLAVAEHAFFKEPITTWILLAGACFSGALYLASRNIAAVPDTVTDDEAESDGEELQVAGDDDGQFQEEQHSVDRHAGGGEIDVGSGSRQNPQ